MNCLSQSTDNAMVGVVVYEIIVKLQNGCVYMLSYRYFQVLFKD